MSILTRYVERRIRKGDWMDLLKFVLASRFVTDWTGLHRRDIAVGLVILNAAISVLTSTNVVAAFPALQSAQAVLLGISAAVGAGGVFDKAYDNPVSKK